MWLFYKIKAFNLTGIVANVYARYLANKLDYWVIDNIGKELNIL